MYVLTARNSIRKGTIVPVNSCPRVCHEKKQSSVTTMVYRLVHDILHILLEHLPITVLMGLLSEAESDFELHPKLTLLVQDNGELFAELPNVLTNLFLPGEQLIAHVHHLLLIIDALLSNLHQQASSYDADVHL